MIKFCIVCNTKYNIPNCRWESRKIKVPCCSKKCKQSSIYKEEVNKFLIETRGFPLGYNNLQAYQNRFIPKKCLCKNCLKEFTPKYEEQQYCSKKMYV